MIVASVFTLITYILSIALLSSYFDTSYITWNFIWKVLAVAGASWLPLHVTKWLISKIAPSE